MDKMDTWTITLLNSNINLMIFLCAVVVVIVFWIKSMITNKRSNISNAGDETGVKQKKSMSQNIDGLKRPPGPKPYPIIGNMACLHGYKVPYQAFDDLAKKYGPIISLRLGSTSAVVVNGIDNIREVLVTKSSDFCDRPNFFHLHNFMRGNKENSMVFSNWSKSQKMRRKILNQHTNPQKCSTQFQHLNAIIKNQMQTMIGDIKAKRSSSTTNSTVIDIIPVIMHACANIFTQYFCSRSFSSNNTKFQQMIRNYNLFHWEFNQVYAADFLPFLLPLHSRHFQRMDKRIQETNDFILENIIQDRRGKWAECNDGHPDYVESLIDQVQNQSDVEPKMDWEIALHQLKEILGGHPAIGFFLVKIFGFISALPEVQQNIQKEIDTILAKNGTMKFNFIELSDQRNMPYTDAVILESLRLIASPIIPHIANRTSSIGGYLIEKDAFIFLNNYNLNMSPELWDEPTAFKPERFIQNGCIVKPDHFLPFGTGRRSCVGHKMVQFVTFSVLVSCMQHFSIRPPPNVTHKVTVGSLIVNEKSYEMIFTERA